MLFTSLLDNDLYKFTMMQFAFHHFPNSEVEYQLFYRDPNTKLEEKVIDQLQDEIGKVATLRLCKEEISFLKNLNVFSSDFLQYLETFSLQEKDVRLERGHLLKLSIKGRWHETILWEVILLALLSELHFDRILYKQDREGEKKLKDKVDYLKKQDIKVHFMEFGTRRRFSKKWQRNLNTYLKEELPDQFMGTSNIRLSMDLGLQCYGTMGHEFLQAGQRISSRLEQFQTLMLDWWFKEYHETLSIALADVLSLSAFLHDFQGDLAQKYVGLRIDSGNPFELGEKVVNFYIEQGIDPLRKKIIFSDSLNFNKAAKIAAYFQGKIQVAFGIGTYLTNDHGVPPLNLVIKMVSFDNQAVGKLTDTPEKTYCLDSTFLAELQKIDSIKKYESTTNRSIR